MTTPEIECKEKCPECEGAGRFIFNGWMGEEVEPCEACNGTGKFVDFARIRFGVPGVQR